MSQAEKRSNTTRFPYLNTVTRVEPYLNTVTRVE